MRPKHLRRINIGKIANRLAVVRNSFFYATLFSLCMFSFSSANAALLKDVNKVDGGARDSLALKSDGTVWTWGENKPQPFNVEGLENISAIQAGFSFRMAIKKDGTVWAWGSNSYGQLGDGTTTSRGTPGQVLGLSGITSIANGVNHALALKDDGTVWSWGHTIGGRLGTGDPTSQSAPTPKQIDSLSGIVAIAAGTEHSLALKNDGTVWSWGLDGLNPSYAGNFTPVKVKDLNNVVAIAGGYTLSLVLKNDGTVWTWGFNIAEQPVNGVLPRVYSPLQVNGLSDITAIAAGVNFGLALKKDGTVWAWGDNGFGQLGNGTTTHGSIPVQVSGLSGVTAISAGSDHSMALKDGAIWAWGKNDYGQLGDGTKTNRSTPTQVIIPDQPTIAASASIGGTITPSGQISVASGSKVNFTITPSAGYKIENVQVDGASVGAVSSYTFSNVTVGHSINATFVADAAPTIATFAPSTTSCASGKDVSFTLNATVPTGVTLSYLWDFDSDGVTDKTTTENTASYAFKDVGAHKVTVTAVSSTGQTAKSTAEVIVRNALVEATDKNIAVIATQNELNAADVRLTYGVQNNREPVSSVQEFTAKGLDKDAVAMLHFKVYGLSGSVSALSLCKLKTDGSPIEYVYGSSADKSKDGAWWFTDDASNDVGKNAILDASKTYTVNFAIKDGGRYDQDSTSGTIKDPLALLKESASTDTSMDTSGGSNTSSSDGGSSGGGCVLIPMGSASLDLALLVLGGAGLTALKRRRK